MLFFDAFGWISLVRTPDILVKGYLALVGTAVVWTFGASALEVWRGESTDSDSK